MKNNKIESLQMLRALAVFLVIYAHSIDKSYYFFGDHSSVQSRFFFLENWGAIGLDLFFVISGFIMTIVTPSYFRIGGAKDFLIKRFIRIVPLYWGLTVLFSVLLCFRNNSPQILQVLKAFLFLPFFDSVKFINPVINVGWSLSFEIYFYLLIGLLLIFLDQKIYKYLIISILFLSIIGVFFNPSLALLRFITSPLLLEFALGIGAGLVYINYNIKSILIPIVLILLGVGISILTIFTGYLNISEADFVEADNLIAFFRVLIWGLPCSLLLTGVVLLEKVTQYSTPKFLILIGDASYSAYLIHTMFFPFYVKAFLLIGVLSSDMFVISCACASVLISIPFYKFVEMALTRFINSSWKKVTNKPLPN